MCKVLGINRSTYYKCLNQKHPTEMLKNRNSMRMFWQFIMTQTTNATDILENLFWMETFGLLELFKLEQVRESDEDWVIIGSYNEPNYFQYHAPIGITVK